MQRIGWYVVTITKKSEVSENLLSAALIGPSLQTLLKISTREELVCQSKISGKNIDCLMFDIRCIDFLEEYLFLLIH